MMKARGLPPSSARRKSKRHRPEEDLRDGGCQKIVPGKSALHSSSTQHHSRSEPQGHHHHHAKEEAQHNDDDSASRRQEPQKVRMTDAAEVVRRKEHTDLMTAHKRKSKVPPPSSVASARRERQQQEQQQCVDDVFVTPPPRRKKKKCPRRKQPRPQSALSGTTATTTLATRKSTERDHDGDDDNDAVPTTSSATTATLVSPPSSPPQQQRLANHSSSATIAALEARYAPLLCDAVHGDRRAAFLPLPSSVAALLQTVWNLNDRATTTTDRVTKCLRRVHGSYTTNNLLFYAVQSPGFPATTTAADGELFQGHRALAQRAESALSVAVTAALCRHGYQDATRQTLVFYLSFLQTRQRSSAQDPHIDFDWNDALPPAEADDYANYKLRVPWVAFFPLTTAGMQVELWKARANHYQLDDDDDDGRGVLVDIPMGCLLLARGDVVHAGGFRSSDASNNGNPRGHLYIYRAAASGRQSRRCRECVHATNATNTYRLPGSSQAPLLKTVYAHALDAPVAPDAATPLTLRRPPQKHLTTTRAPNNNDDDDDDEEYEF